MTTPTECSNPECLTPHGRLLPIGSKGRVLICESCQTIVYPYDDVSEPVCVDCGSLNIALPEVTVPSWYAVISGRAAELYLVFPTYEHCMAWADQRRVPEGLLEEKALAVANLPTGTWEDHSGNRKPRYHDPWLTLTNWVRGAMNKKPVRTGY